MSAAVSLFRCRRVAAAVAALCLAIPLHLQAADAVAGAVPQSSFSSLLQVLFGLGLVLGAIAGTAWLLRRLAPGQVVASGALRVVGGVAVGPKERVVLVDIGDTRLVLGVAPGQVTTLHQMPRPAEETGRIADSPLPQQFADRLKQVLRRKQAGHAPD